MTNEHRPTLRSFRHVTPRRVGVRSLSIARTSTTRGLGALVHGLNNVSLFLLDSNVNFRGPRLSVSVRLGATHAGIRKFAHVISATFSCFGRRNNKRLTIVDSVTKAGNLNVTPTCSTAGHFRGACVSTLRRLSRLRGLGVHFASVHPKFITATLLNSNGRCPVLVGTSGINRTVAHTLGHGHQAMVVSKHCHILIFF